MKNGCLFCSLSILFSCVIGGADIGEKKSVYIVYTGAASSTPHTQVLASVLNRREHVEKRLVHVYSRGFSGFAALLTQLEANQIGQRSDVVSVFADPIYQLHTTRSWDFLEYISHQQASSPHAPDPLSGDTIVGILDTGIWPESESFSDKGMGPIPSRWKGVCMQGYNFTSSSCNRKLIGVRYYSSSRNNGGDPRHPNDKGESGRDTVGHGTHTASTAAGSFVSNASYYGLATGTAKGGSPGSRIAVYKVCTFDGCAGSDILAAFDDAISDGVDVLSLSLGAPAFMKLDYSNDPLAIGSFHAFEKGITVVCSAGNDGPSSGTVVNAAPWILTVAATTLDRDFQSDIVLGGNITIKGEGINFSHLQNFPVHSLIYSKSAKSNLSTEDEARNCYVKALDGDKIKGKIVICDHSGSYISKREVKDGLEGGGAIGLILIDDLERFVASPSGDFPMSIVSSKEGSEILSYINSTTSPVATILPTETVIQYKPAPKIAYFSSRGPCAETKNILKPDIAAPGVNILAAWIQTNSSDNNLPKGKQPPLFNLLSGTSMSCPHVTGIAAALKSAKPNWSPSAIKSAIMTTATEMNNAELPLTTDSGSTATPYDYGAGEVNPQGTLQPGLVYETTPADYLQFLCNYGYDIPTIKLITNVSKEFECPKNSSKDMMSNLNYPSIAISSLTPNESKSITRTLTNVGDLDETEYTVTVKSPQGLDVKVVPEKLHFTTTRKKISYQVVFSTTSSTSAENASFGSLTWTNGKYQVRTLFVVDAS